MSTAVRLRRSPPYHGNRRVLQHTTASHEKEPLDTQNKEISSLVQFPSNDDDTIVVQVITTRFMQNQPDLVELGLARLELLRTICLPTLIQQTSHNFLWIIRTDPNLHDDIQQPLFTLIQTTVQAYPSLKAILVGSNNNPDGFRRPDILDISKDQIWTHNYQLLESYHQAAQSRIVLETRLDADDGLHRYFVQMIQQEATLYLQQPQHTSNNWLIWCAATHLEWQYGIPWESKNNGEEEKYYGSLLPGNADACITAGLTKGYGAAVLFEDLPVANHEKVHRQVTHCQQQPPQHPNSNDDQMVLYQECLIVWKRLLPTAIRGRTPTSAGMKHVVVGSVGSKKMVVSSAATTDSQEEEEEEGDDDVQKERQSSKDRNHNKKPKTPEELKQLQPIMWKAVQKHFRIQPDSVGQLRIYLTQHMASLTQDNLRGQCTPGHSCKQSSQELLQQLAATTTNTS